MLFDDCYFFQNVLSQHISFTNEENTDIVLHYLLKFLLGERHDELVELVSLEKRVTRQAPPFFLWHTADDTCVPVENALLLDRALRARQVRSELHIYPSGGHGQSLADGTVYAPGEDWRASASCSVWVGHCADWLHRNFGDYAVAPHPDEIIEQPKKKKKC